MKPANGGTRVVSTGPIIAWYVWLGKAIVLLWPLGAGPAIVSGWVGWFLGIVGQVVWLVWLVHRMHVRTRTP